MYPNIELLIYAVIALVVVLVLTGVVNLIITIWRALHDG
jgi:hypothetical protein